MDYTKLEKGVYSPPLKTDFPDLKRRIITIDNYIEGKIAMIIGKAGSFFYNLTEKYNLLYIFFNKEKKIIELYGLDDGDLMNAVRSIIKKIKYFNHLSRSRHTESSWVKRNERRQNC